MESEISLTLLIIGVFISAAVLGGVIAKWIRLPKVTAYLLVGLFLGPHVLDLLPSQVVEAIPQWITGIWPIIKEEHHDVFAPIGNFAMALVLFHMGCDFTLVHFRRIMPRVMRLSFGELGLTFLLVTTGLVLIGAQWQAALLFGTLALATAPATTILVLKENESEGMVTEFTTAMVAINNLVCIIAFEILFMIMMFMSGGANAGILPEIFGMLQSLALSLVIGCVGGLVVAYSCSFLTNNYWLTIVVAVTAMSMGFCGIVNCSYLLTFLAMGITVANVSDITKDIEDELNHFTGMLCVVFFVSHGAELDVNKLLGAGLIGFAYIGLRLAGKYIGVWAMADVHQDGPLTKRWLGCTLFSQAGAAIALSYIAVKETERVGGSIHEMAVELEAVILGTVVFFEIFGPIMIRRALMNCGEVPLGQAISHSDRSLLGEVRAMANRALLAIGVNPWKQQSEQDVLIEDLMQRNVKTLGASNNFQTTVEFIEASRDNTYPVVTDEDVVVGIIRFADLRNEHFDPGLGALVCALDLARPTFPRLHPAQTIADAWDAFNSSGDDVLPVITPEEPQKLVGVIRRRDILKVLSNRTE